jgi:hypothetical protein
MLTSRACKRMYKSSHCETTRTESGEGWRVRSFHSVIRAKYLYFRSSMAATNGIDVLISATSSASGSQNVGDRCYLNSIVQCLSRTPLLMANFAVEHGTSGAALNCLRDLTKLTSMLSIQDNGNASKDLANLLTCIQDKYQQTGRHSPAVENIFSGVHNSRLTCLRCGCCSQLDGEQFYHLNIAVPAGNVASVPDAVAAFTAAELLTSDHRWECVACKMKAQVRQCSVYAACYAEFYTYLLWTSSLQPMKQVGLVKLPPVLVLRLKCSDELGGNATTQIQLDPGLTFASTEGDSWEYSLYGVVVHVSTGSELGHYVAYVKVKHEQLRHYVASPYSTDVIAGGARCVVPGGRQRCNSRALGTRAHQTDRPALLQFRWPSTAVPARCVGQASQCREERLCCG